MTYSWRRRTRPPKDFLQWRTAERDKRHDIPLFKKWQSQELAKLTGQDIETLIARYKAIVLDDLKNNNNCRIYPQQTDPNINFSPDELREIVDVGRICFETNRAYELIGKHIEKIEILVRDTDTRTTINKSITIRNCWVEHLVVPNNRACSLVIEDCWIGRFEISPKGINSISMRGGGVLEFNVPTPGQNPFDGPVNIDFNVFLPRSLEFGLKDAQSYRNLRHHLNALNNTRAASSILSAELAIERHLQAQSNNFFDALRRRAHPDNWISLLYDLVADYGSSISQPLWWAGLLFLSCVLILTLTFGLTVNHDEIIKGSWQEILRREGFAMEAGKSALYTLQSFLNPFGIFGRKDLLVVNDFRIAAIVNFLSFCGTISLTLFVIALRRRFKLA